MMTPEKIRAAKELAERAAPDGWTATNTNMDGVCEVIFGRDTQGLAYSWGQINGFDCEDNAAFIAASRTLIPALCDTALAAIAERDAAMAVVEAARRVAKTGLYSSDSLDALMANVEAVNAFDALLDKSE